MMKTDTIIVPLYICYVFGNNEFSMEDLQSATEESAQYSLHVVGFVMHRVQRILFVDEAVIGGSNMEFLAIPLKILNHRSTTKVSAYDRSEMKKTIFIAKPNGGIEIKRPAKKRARSNTDQVSC